MEGFESQSEHVELPRPTPPLVLFCYARRYLNNTTTKVTPAADNGISSTNHRLSKHGCCPSLRHDKGSTKDTNEGAVCLEGTVGDKKWNSWINIKMVLMFCTRQPR